MRAKSNTRGRQIVGPPVPDSASGSAGNNLQAFPWVKGRIQQVILLRRHTSP